MKKFGSILLITLFTGTLFSAEESRTLAITSFTPASLGQAYTGVASPVAGNLWLNPSLPAVDPRFQTSFLSGTSFSNQLNLIQLSLPIAIGKVSAAYASLHDSEPYDFSRFSVGFAREIIQNVFFGFDAYNFTQIKLDQSDSAWGGDLGLFFLDRNSEGLSALRIDHHRFGFSVHSIGKPSQLPSESILPPLGVKAGWGFRWLVSPPFEAFGEINGTLDALPFHAFGNLSLRFRMSKTFSLYGGLIFGQGIENLEFWSAGASFSLHFANSDLEIFYHLNPQKSNHFLHSLGIEFAWGDLDRKAPKLSFTVSSFSPDPTGFFSFSPNYDGAKDRISFQIKAQDESPLILWKLVIQDERGKIVKTFERKVITPNLQAKELWNSLWKPVPQISIPDQLTWDGTDDKGNRLPDAYYFAFCEAEDLMRNTAFSITNKIRIDTQAPIAQLGLSEELFSPNHDGRKDSTTIFQELSPDYWKAEIRDSSGKLIRSWEWKQNPPKEIIWKGLNQRGDLVEDGIYDYLLYGSDESGNRTLVSIPGIQVNTSAYSVLIDVKPTAISPVLGQSLQVFPSIPKSDGLKEWKLFVESKNGGKILLKQGKKIPKAFSWNAQNPNGEFLADDTYFFHIQANFENGASPESLSRPVLVDNTPPSFEFGWEPKLFTPDQDGQNDELEFHFIAQDPGGIQDWKIEIFDPSGNVFQTFEGKGNPATNIYWSGKSLHGESVQSARDYSVKLSLSDTPGNSLSNLSMGKITIGVLQEPGINQLKIALPPLRFPISESALQGENYPILNRLAEILTRFPDLEIEIRGYSLSIEISPHQLALARAESVKSYLTGRGISFERLHSLDGGVLSISSFSNAQVEFILKK